jgi:2-keto-4-pentenoate hydratase
VGKKVALDKVDVGAVKVAMTLDGAEANKGAASDALGDQWKALLWLVNGAIEKGYTLEPGQVLITGAMGQMIPGKPGKYEADYGALGTLSFTVK